MVAVGVLVASSGALSACGGITQEGGAGTTGGASSGGASSGGAAATGGDCVAQPVTFSVRPAAGSVDEWCVGLPNCSSLVTLRDPLGEALELHRWCGVACESCEDQLCPPLICIGPHRLEPGFDEFAWDGTHVVDDTCGAAASQCNRSTCASPGRYTAVVCVVPNLATDPADESCANLVSATPTCVEQPFDVGDATAVTITLPAQE
jgi:hypothetical protein